MRIPFEEINKDWTLFLDRDGVINHEKHLDYINTWSEFAFYHGVKDAMKTFAALFSKIIIVTNQKGVGKGITKLDDLLHIHENMENEIVEAGGRIDAIYFCSDLENDSPNRKPQPGMGLQAIARFPEINPTKSIMIGNTIGDMQFGRNLGCYTIFLPTTHPEVLYDDKNIDAVFTSLYAFAEMLESRKF